MKIFKSFKSGISLTAKVREVMLTILPLLHVTLVIAPVYTFLACVAYVDSGISSVQYFFSSLLLIIPATILSTTITSGTNTNFPSTPFNNL